MEPERNPDPSVIVPDWGAPAPVHACSSTRRGGTSRAPFDSLNLSASTGDDEAAVGANRARLLASSRAPAEPCWLRQEHGTRVVEVGRASPPGQVADAAVTAEAGVVCAVLTADCLPVLLCDDAGTRVGVAHAGWRGLAGGVLEAAVAAFPGPREALMAWLGPAIGPRAFEVGPEVRAAFLRADPGAEIAFAPSRRAGHWLADLYALARRRLGALGVGRITGGGRCTHSESGDFYSHRRDGRRTGRMATLIWIDR